MPDSYLMSVISADCSHTQCIKVKKITVKELVTLEKSGAKWIISGK